MVFVLMNWAKYGDCIFLAIIRKERFKVLNHHLREGVAW